MQLYTNQGIGTSAKITESSFARIEKAEGSSDSDRWRFFMRNGDYRSNNIIHLFIKPIWN